VSNPNGSDTYCKEINIMKPNAIKLIKDYGLTLSPNPRQDYLLLNVKENCPKALQMSSYLQAEKKIQRTVKHIYFLLTL